jgi:hypothetical protein
MKWKNGTQRVVWPHYASMGQVDINRGETAGGASLSDTFQCQVRRPDFQKDTFLTFAECVFEAVLVYVETNLPKEVLKVTTGFGGEVGLFGHTCGAISGAVLAINAMHSRSEPPDTETPKAS